MARDRIERLHYYQRQYLGAGDFEAQQEYHRCMRRRHNLGPHTWGIVAGLELVEVVQEGGGGGVDVYVLPGLAIDGFGREIVVLAPYRLEGGLFEPFRNQGDRFLRVAIAYDEELTQRPRPGYELCDEDDQFARVRESFRLVVDPQPPLHDALVVAGHQPATGTRPPLTGAEDVSALLTVPRDESVPHQELPDDDDRPHWPVPIGNVHWDGQKLVPDDADPPLLNQDRAYSGAVAEQVVAPRGALVMRHRWSPEVRPAKKEPDGADDPDFGVQAEVQGSLRVDRVLIAEADVQVHGGHVDFRDAAGDPAGVPLTVHRVEVNAVGGRDLRITLGDAETADNRLAVGPDGVDKWVVAADGGVVAEGHFDFTGQLALDGDLDFADGPGDKLMLDGEIDQPASKGLGVEGGSLYARAPSAHRWYLSSLADAGASDAMQLDGLGLRVEGDVRLGGDVELDDAHGDRIVLRGAKNDPNAMTVGTESGTLFAKADQRHRWYIGHNRDGGGSDEMELTTAGLTVQGLVNGRSMAADGAKLDGISFQAKNVRVLTGQVTHGGAIFPPAGYSFAQSRVLLSVRAFHPPAFDVNEFGVSARFGIEAFAVAAGNHWTAQVRWRQEGHGGATGWRSGPGIVADYIVIGVK